MRKIGIVGSIIPEEDLLARGEGFELWSVNNLFEKFPNVTFSRWYEIHVIEKRDGSYFRRGYLNYPIYGEQSVEEYMRKLDDLGITVFMQKKWKEIKKSEVFPFEKIMGEFGSYMGCSFAWMVAQIMQEGADEIRFFGVPLDGNEYYYQRPSVEFLLGRAIERGIKVTNDETSKLLTANYIYAYNEDFDTIYLLHGSLAYDMGMTILTDIQQKLEQL